LSNINDLIELRVDVTPRVLPRYDNFKENTFLSGSPLACLEYGPQGVDELMNPTKLENPFMIHLLTQLSI